MSSYLVLARKYRSKQFNDVVGQQSVIRTINNAIKLDRTHHAYVFSGSRGIGKTSIARIFSKVLRCPNVVTKEDGLLYSCDQCSDCIEIASGTSVNVLEIDGASNNGVDSVREIRENAKFLPTSGKYKIYIIDEVHMLSTAAFNALLKTLEEPPEHVVFVFATTESHKIPETILGRCQRFDFKRVTVAQIMGHLKNVLGQEGITYEEAALNLIARGAEGSMRDALSITDQVISFSGMNITAQAVRDSIGLIGTELVYAILKSIVDRNAKEGLSLVQGAFNQGVDLKVLLKAMIEMLHALILMQVGIEKPETHFNDDELKQLSTLKGARPLEENELIFQVLHHGLDLLSRAAQPKLIFDLLVIKTALAEAIVAVGNEAAESAAGSKPANDRGLPRPPAAELSEARPSAPKPADLGPPPGHPAHAGSENELASNAASRREMIQQMSSPAPAAAMTKAPPPAAEPPKMGGLNFSFGSPSPEKAEAKAVAAVPAGVQGPKSWEGFIDFCDRKAPAIGVILESVVEPMLPSEQDNTLKLGFRENDPKSDQVQLKAFRDQLTTLSENYFGMRIQLEVFFSQIKGESMAEKTERIRKEKRELRMQSILANEVVQEAKALFGSDLTNIELLEKET